MGCWWSSVCKQHQPVSRPDSAASDMLRQLVPKPATLPDAVKAKLGEQWSTQTYNIEYGGFLSNHLAHGVIALAHLGATESRINDFVDEYSTKLEPPSDAPAYMHDSGSAVVEFDTSLLGARKNWYGILGFYLNEVESKGWTNAVKEYFPRLSAGIAGSAFHGLIQLGYGANAGNERVVAEGLAYLHHSHVPFAPHREECVQNASVEKKIDIQTALQRIRDNPTFSRVVKEHSEEMKRRLGNTSGFQVAMLALSEYAQADLASIAVQISIPDDCDLGEFIIDSALEVYTRAATKNDFFLLHGVTAAWSLQQVLPLLSKGDALDAGQRFITALLATYVARGEPSLTEPLTKDTPDDKDWNAVVERAVALVGDEHIYKLVQVCAERASRDTEHKKWKLYYTAAKNVLDYDLAYWNTQRP